MTSLIFHEWIFGINIVNSVSKTMTGFRTCALLEKPELEVQLIRDNGFARYSTRCRHCAHRSPCRPVERIAHQIPDRRQKDVIYLNASNQISPLATNPLWHVRGDHITLAASGFLEVFKKMWPEAWGVRMEHILRNVLLALLEQHNVTMRDIQRIEGPLFFESRVASPRSFRLSLRGLGLDNSRPLLASMTTKGKMVLAHS